MDIDSSCIRFGTNLLKLLSELLQILSLRRAADLDQLSVRTDYVDVTLRTGLRERLVCTSSTNDVSDTLLTGSANRIGPPSRALCGNR